MDERFLKRVTTTPELGYSLVAIICARYNAKVFMCASKIMSCQIILRPSPFGDHHHIRKCIGSRRVQFTNRMLSRDYQWGQWFSMR